MSDDANKGKAFERSVRDVLFALRDKYPDLVRVIEQPRLGLYDGQEVIPDFDLQFDLIFEESRYLIECQDRSRSAPQIAQKIKYMKGLSSRNRFIFVHGAEIPEATRKALEADGVVEMSFEEFVSFVARLEIQLRAQTSLLPLEDSKFADEFRKLFPAGRGPMSSVRKCS